LDNNEEVDPLHGELSDFINRQQIAYLNAINDRIMDNKFGDFTKFETSRERCHTTREVKITYHAEPVTRNRKPSLTTRPTRRGKTQRGIYGPR
jgi:hypothetical protein